jgi:hypothetical protein
MVIFFETEIMVIDIGQLSQNKFLTLYGYNIFYFPIRINE